MTDKKYLVALDMDGTITQHKTHLEQQNRTVLKHLSEYCHLVMVGAGSCQRIFKQLDRFPLDVVGCYGMEAAHWNEATGALVTDYAEIVPQPDRTKMEQRAQIIRDKYNFTEYMGDSVEFHSSGMMTFALLGTAAQIEDKLAFDPDRSKRRAAYPEVCALFPEYTVFIGGSSSYDIVPRPYDKKYALDRYCALHGFARENVVYFGDDYGPGGNDEQVFRSDYLFITVDNYRAFPKRAAVLQTLWNL